MNSYVEIAFIHNLLIHSIALTLANIFSRKVMSMTTFIFIVFTITFLPSFLFLNIDSWIWIHEICIFIFLFKDRTHTYLIFVGNRILFHILYYLLIEGSIQHLQFFPFEYPLLFIFDFILLFLYLSLLVKAKYRLSEKDFLCSFYLNHKKYKGYIDSGNLATYEGLPIIFIQENIYHQIESKPILLDIQTIQDENTIQAKHTFIKINNKTIEVYCAQVKNCTYDAILNMKGIL